MERIHYFLIFLSFSLVSVAYSQNKDRLQKEFELEIQQVTDSAVLNNALFVDTLNMDFDSLYKSLTDDYKFFSDSLYKAVKDSINIKRKDSLNSMTISLRKSFDEFYYTTKDSIRNHNSNFVNFIKKTESQNRDCPDCKNKDDFSDNLDEYRDLLDSLSGMFQDSVSVLADSLESHVEAKMDVLMDSLSDYAGDLIDNQIDEDESKRETNEAISDYYNDDYDNKSELDFELNYQSHTSYRGRDNGFVQHSFSPSVAYQSSSGFALSGDLVFLNNTSRALDEVDVGISYDHDFSDYVSVNASFSHSWFNDSSRQSSASLDNSLSAGMSFGPENFKIGFSSEVDFGHGNSEFTFTGFTSFPLTLSQQFLSGELSTEPSFTVNIGQQNSEVLAKRRMIGGFQVPVFHSKNVLSIMDYEFSLPLTLETDHISIEPAVTYIIPRNVLDASTQDGFLNFSLDVTIPVKLK